MIHDVAPEDANADPEEIDVITGLNRGHIEPLLSLMRSERPIPREVRLLLADILDPAGSSTWKATFRKKHGSQDKVISIVAGLRTEGDIPRKTRLELAETILNPASTSRHAVELVRRRAGNPEKTRSGLALAEDQLRIGERVARLYEQRGHGNWESVIAEVMREFGKKRSTVTDAYRLYKGARQSIGEPERD